MPASGQNSQNSQNGQTNQNTQPQSQDFEALVKRVTERVWELWREDLRLNRERRSDPSRK